MNILTVAALSLLWCASAHASGTFGQELLEECKLQNATLQSEYCLGYIEGALQAVATWETSDEVQKRTHNEHMCYLLPDEVTNGQVRLILVKYLADHPKRLHLPAIILFIEALQETFPCKEVKHSP